MKDRARGGKQRRQPRRRSKRFGLITITMALSPPPLHPPPP